MRPKSPFLQNLRKKKPEPTMSKKVAKKETEQTIEGFHKFSIGSYDENFVPYSVEDPDVDLEPIKEEPKINLDEERKLSFQQGYAKAKKEFGHYKNDAELLEKNFKEILLNMEQARHQWIHEVRVSVASAIQVSLSQIVQHEALQVDILQQKLSEALEHLSEEKKMKVIVAPNFKEFAIEYLKDKSEWVVETRKDITGGAIFESDNGVWDARLSVTLDEIHHLIQTWLVEKSGE
jgi:flagellar biosynthesis/type III secretory pathway protein FliH